MTERYGYGYRDEPGGGERPSGRGAVAERRAGQEEVREVDLTDEAADREQEAADAGQPPRDEREASGAFEPHPVAAAGTSIFDVGREENADREEEEEAATASGTPEATTGEGGPESAEREDAEAEAAEAEAAAAEVAAAEVGDAEVEAADRDEAAAAAAAEVGAAEAQAAEEPAAPAAAPEPAAPAAAAAAPETLLGSLDAEGAHNRFLDIQAGFVDEPHQAVEEAGRFVDELVQQVTDALQAQRSQLQAAGDDASTEDLRLTLRAYRQFVDRLLGLAR
jgi:hypothetical protein